MATESLRFIVQTLKPLILKRQSSRWELSGRGWEAAHLQRCRWGRIRRLDPSTHHFAQILGKHPFPISERGTPTSDLRGPEGPRAEREKLTRASPSRAREVTHRNGPPSSLLRSHSLRRKKPLMLPQPESCSRSCRRRSYHSPGVAGDWRAASPHHSATLDLQ